MPTRLEFVPRTSLAEWDNDLAAADFAHPYQSTAFAEYGRARGYRPDCLDLVAGGERVGQCVVLIGRSRVATWFYGPVLYPSCPIPLQDAVASLLEFLRRRGVIAVRDAVTAVPYGGENLAEVDDLWHLRESPFIDLRRDDGLTSQHFDKSVRKNVRKCRDAGATVTFTSDVTALGPYTEMLQTHRQRLGLGMPPFYPTAEALKSFSRPKAFFQVAVAEQNGVPLAGLGFVGFGGVVVEVGVAQSDQFQEAKLPVHDLIKVEAVRVYRERGLKIYDLAGIARPPETEKEQNIRRFKLKFTNEIGTYASVESDLSPAKFFVLRVRRRLGLARVGSFGW